MEIHIIQVGQKGLPSFVPEKQKGGQHYLDNIRLKKNLGRSTVRAKGAKVGTLAEPAL
jgi:hypothetical protein